MVDTLHLRLQNEIYYNELIIFKVYLVINVSK